MNVSEWVRRAIANITFIPLEEIKLESNLYKDLDMDWQDMEDLVAALEDGWGIDIDIDGAGVEFHTVQEVISFMERFAK